MEALLPRQEVKLLGDDINGILITIQSQLAVQLQLSTVELVFTRSSLGILGNGVRAKPVKMNGQTAIVANFLKDCQSFPCPDTLMRT